uniref:DUF8039 domain-containing protein n=1 Tax=Setaria viridis TaxID=4556 RepID=A0A4U6SWD7_SETVI|nr:hypothetical protein SEVIR_9G107400v2 [Setaria viridis]
MLGEGGGSVGMRGSAQEGGGARGGISAGTRRPDGDERWPGGEQVALGGENDDQSLVHSPPRFHRTSTLYEVEVAASAPQPSATTAFSSNLKRKRGQRSRNQIPEKGSLVIEELGGKGEPILPEGISDRFRNICGAVVRDKLKTWITTSNWMKVFTTTKDVLWATLAKVQKKNLWRLYRKKDQLTAAIGTVEHSRRVRGISSTLPWGKEFSNDQANYRKRNRYKKNFEEKMREIAKQKFLEFLANHAMSQTMADPTVSHGFVAPSSAGSIANVRYPVDNIQVDTPCILVILYGRKQNKFREVATGMAITGHVFPKAPPPEYAWVLVVTVLDESCEIDIPTDEGIEVLSDAMNQYILWHP